MNDAPPPVQKRKLIEVALPLEKINTALKTEKDRKVGKPQSIHHWWARRPITAARSILFAQLVDDPSSRPNLFTTAEMISTERARLHRILANLAQWDAIYDQQLMTQAQTEIADCNPDGVPPLLDPFAGGGSIPLEAQRLGLETHASDLNPVAVLINKCLIEYAPRFGGKAPVYPGTVDELSQIWPGTTGLTSDVQNYGDWMRVKAQTAIGDLYPRARKQDGVDAQPISWIWARTVCCPNPACGIDAPLVKSWTLSKHPKNASRVVASVVEGRVHFEVRRLTKDDTPARLAGTIGRMGAECISCGAVIDLPYIRREGVSRRIRQQHMATVLDTPVGRKYISPCELGDTGAESDLAVPDDLPAGEIPEQALGFRVRAYGFTKFTDLFTPRQLRALCTLSDLIAETRRKAYSDAIAAGWDCGDSLAEDGQGALAYSHAIATYLTLALSRLADWSNSFCRWESKGQVSQQLFGQQTISMTWDFSEAWPLGSKNSGSFGACVRVVTSSLAQLSVVNPGVALQQDASSRDYSKFVVSTDPPYYANIGYADLSDFFYIWIRRAIRDLHTDLLATILVPKADELVANPARHGGDKGAAAFFEGRFEQVFESIRKTANPAFPITVYYAYKQTEVSVDGSSSTGWETILEAMISAGWAITSTWPVSSEMSSRLRGIDSNALASSIVVSLRARQVDSIKTSRRDFVSALKAELPTSLRELQQGTIAPVDLPQAAIGPGMAVFSRYAAVLSDNGSPMSVRAALSLINEVLDEVLSEQEGDFDPDTRFALAWFRQHGFDSGDFGDADNLARARNASLEHLDRAGILSLRGTRGKVTLLAPVNLDENWDPSTDRLISVWEVVMHLSRVLTDKGVVAASALLTRVPASIDRDLCKELAFLLFALAEDSKRTKDAVEFNALGTAWNDIAAGVGPSAEQGTFDYTGD